MRGDLEVLHEAIEARDAAIAALEAENERLRQEIGRLQRRVEQAGEVLVQRDAIGGYLKLMTKRAA